MVRLRLPLLVGWLAGLLVCSLGCQLDHPNQLKPCAQKVLDQYRPWLAHQFDPLRLPDYDGKSGRYQYWLSNIRVLGASQIQIKQLKVLPFGHNKALIIFSVYWRHLRAELNAKARGCRKIFWKRRCASLRGRPIIKVSHATASLSTVWQAAYVKDHIKIIPSRTKVTIRLGKIHVKLRLKGLAGLILKIFGKAVRRFVSRKVRKMWDRQRPKIEKRLSSNLEKLINKHVGPALQKVLRGRVPKKAIAPPRPPIRVSRPRPRPRPHPVPWKAECGGRRNRGRGPRQFVAQC